MPDIVHFEITSPDVEASAAFYADIFGWRIQPSPWVPDYVLLDGEGTTTGAVMADRYKSQAVILWHSVADLDATLKAILAAGGAQAGEINTIPGQGRVVYANDPKGVIFGLKQPQ